MISFDFGSGVVIGDEGQILTAFHVVRGRGPAERPGGRPPGVRGRDHRRRPAERPGRDRARSRPRACPPPGSSRWPWATPASSARGRSCSRWATRSTPPRTASPRRAGASSRTSPGRLEPDQDEMTSFARRSSSANYPDPAPARRQAQPGHERRGRGQPEGGAGRPDHRWRRAPPGSTPWPATPSRWTASAGGPSRRSRQGKEIEYGFLGIQPRPRRAPTGSSEVTPNSPAGAGRRCRPTTRSSPSTTSRSSTSTRLILAINAFAAGRRGPAQDPPRTARRSSKTVVLAKYPVDGEMIATNRPPAWRGLRVDYHEHPERHARSTPTSSSTMPRRAWSSPRSRTARPPPAPG